jgi:diaminopimelate decarboxylase
MQNLPPSLVLPFSAENIDSAIRANGGITPFHLYSEDRIARASRRLYAAFSKEGIPFKNFYAVKACPNPSILRILANEGMGMDCSSIPEILLSNRVGVNGEGIMFTSNNTSVEEFAYAVKNGAVINLDDLTHIEKLEKVGLPELVCCRFNPGDMKEGNAIIGKPTEAKYGMRRDQILEAYRILKEKGVKRFGLHAMMVSNERSEAALTETSKILFELAVEISQKVGITFDFINL